MVKPYGLTKPSIAGVLALTVLPCFAPIGALPQGSQAPKVTVMGVVIHKPVSVALPATKVVNAVPFGDGI